MTSTEQGQTLSDIQTIADLRERVAELEGALKPFANEARLWPDFQRDDLALGCRPLPSWETAPITLGDLRRAAALSPIQMKEGE
jgi:hypothetical protein